MTARNWKFLVVEDDPDGQDVVQRILRHHGIAFDAFYDAESALPALEQNTYTAAIIDLALPAIDGWGLLSAIRNNPATAGMPCFAVTAFHSAEVAVEAINRGFVAYFPKPLDPTSLVREIEGILNPA
jgi:DNA-binding response OmpR family regulator